MRWALLIVLSGCGHGAPPPSEPRAVAAEGAAAEGAPDPMDPGPEVPPAQEALRCPGASPDSEAAGDAAEGRLDPGPVQRVIHDNLPGITACYERHAWTDRQSGRISVRWVIAADGRVDSAQVVDDTLGNPALGRCLLEEVCAWRFPASGRGQVTVSYPFIFDAIGL